MESCVKRPAFLLQSVVKGTKRYRNVSPVTKNSPEGDSSLHRSALNYSCALEDKVN